MSSAAELHMLYRIGNAPIHLYPFPHVYVRDVFPADFYAELLRHLPPSDAFSPLSKVRPMGSDVYDKTRSVLVLTPEHVGKLAEPYRGFWERIARMLLSGNLGNLLFGKFGQLLQNRFQGEGELEFLDEALLVQDSQNYALGPHTDTPAKVLAFLFYLPTDDSKSHLGTSIYVPKDPAFTCPGGPHYGFDRFERMLTMPYLPNSLFGFLKTSNSFHGVEPVNDADVRRNLLLYDVKVKPRPQVATPPGGSGAAAQFKF
jgi:hypothetical protein